MIHDPFFLHHIVTANTEVATALENMSTDDPNYDEKHSTLVALTKQLEELILREVSR